jgi:hypothetical protein
MFKGQFANPILLLLLADRSVKLPAMFRLTILLISLLWASLLLISWSGANTSTDVPAPTTVSPSARS